MNSQELNYTFAGDIQMHHNGFRTPKLSSLLFESIDERRPRMSDTMSDSSSGKMCLLDAFNMINETFERPRGRLLREESKIGAALEIIKNSSKASRSPPQSISNTPAADTASGSSDITNEEIGDFYAAVKRLGYTPSENVFKRAVVDIDDKVRNSTPARTLSLGIVSALIRNEDPGDLTRFFKVMRKFAEANKAEVEEQRKNKK